MPGKIFISYRRDDDPNGAARIYDALAAAFGEGNLFMDIEGDPDIGIVSLNQGLCPTTA
jgi:hypothetical protein